MMDNLVLDFFRRTWLKDYKFDFDHVRQIVTITTKEGKMEISYVDAAKKAESILKNP